MLKFCSSLVLFAEEINKFVKILTVFNNHTFQFPIFAFFRINFRNQRINSFPNITDFLLPQKFIVFLIQSEIINRKLRVFSGHYLDVVGE